MTPMNQTETFFISLTSYNEARALLKNSGSSLFKVSFWQVVLGIFP